MARRSAAIEKKNTKRSTGEKRRRISRYRRRNATATAICRRVFEALSRTFEAPFVPIEKKKTKQKTGVKTEYKRSNSPFLSLSLSLIENSTDFVTCKSENCFQHLLSYSF